MSLYWPDDAAAVSTEPRLHALVVAVGDYPYLSGPKATPEGKKFGLKPLTTTIHTGARIAAWLTAGLPGFARDDLNGYRNTGCPLGSVEVVYSPPDGTSVLTRPDGTPVAVGPATMADIKAAVTAWFNRCSAHPDNIALFYFAGHGISTTAQFLLASDFYAPGVLDPWENCIDFTGLRQGMRKCKAKTQLFFVDACRERPFDATVQVNPKGQSLVGGAVWSDPPPAATGTYYAAAEGLKAYGPADGPTYFATAVLDALEGAGAGREKGTRKWLVDTFSLAGALGPLTEYLKDEHQLSSLTCSPHPEGNPAPINYPVRGYVRVKVGCKDAAKNSQLALQLTRLPDDFTSAKDEPRPWRGKLAPGDWRIQMKFDSFDPLDLSETLIDPVHVVLEDPV